jgi:hypothetical protein
MKIELNAENSAVIAKYAELTGHTPDGFLNRYLSDNMIALFHLMRKMAIFSAVVFLTISSLLLCSCSDVDEGQGPSHESHYSKIPGSGAVSY